MYHLKALAYTKNRPIYTPLVHLSNTVFIYFFCSMIVWVLSAIRLNNVNTTTCKEYTVDLVEKGIKLIIRKVIPNWNRVGASIMYEVGVMFP